MILVHMLCYKTITLFISGSIGFENYFFFFFFFDCRVARRKSVLAMVTGTDGLPGTELEVKSICKDSAARNFCAKHFCPVQPSVLLVPIFQYNYN
jgi:hypothetical protein